MCEDINELLQEKAVLLVSELSNIYELQSDFVKQVI